MSRSFHSKLTYMLREAQAAGDESTAWGIPVDEVSDMRAEARAQTRAETRAALREYNDAVQRVLERGAPDDVSARDEAMARFQAAGQGVARRDFLKGAGAVAAVAVVPGSALLRSRASTRASQPKVVIVGGGAAGLRCANKLWRRSGWSSTIYEWDDHLGGRINTIRGRFDNDQIVEEHGEYISSEHRTTLDLASSLNLKLDDTDVEPPGVVDTYWLKGRRYTQMQLDHEWSHTYWDFFHNAVKAVPFPQWYKSHNSTGVKWDNMSVPEWIEAKLPEGSGTQFAVLCLEDVISEYGCDPSQSSALVLPWMLGYNDSRGGSGYQFKSSPLLAGTDERWHITGGNDQLISGMYDQVASHIGVRYGHQLIAVVKQSSGQFTCTFQVGAHTETVSNIDRLVLALPFSTLRRADLSKAGFTAKKMKDIKELGYGTSSKIVFQTNGRPWVRHGYSGDMQTDNGVDGAWELNYQTDNYSSPTALITTFPGGANGAAIAPKYGLGPDDVGVPPAKMVKDYLDALDQVFPGVKAAYNGKALYCDGNIDPHILGCYATWGPGQYTTLYGYEGVGEGRAHFCGEHTSVDYSGFMEGAIRSGDRAAREL